MLLISFPPHLLVTDVRFFHVLEKFKQLNFISLIYSIRQSESHKPQIPQGRRQLKFNFSALQQKHLLSYIYFFLKCGGWRAQEPPSQLVSWKTSCEKSATGLNCRQEDKCLCVCCEVWQEDTSCMLQMEKNPLHIFNKIIT